jgi:hypothetical protein
MVENISFTTKASIESETSALHIALKTEGDIFQGAFCLIHRRKGSLNSSVGMATGYGMDD